MALALLTVYLQEQALGLPYLESGTQLKRHLDVLGGTAPKMWQYRILSDYVAEAFIVALRFLSVPHPVAVGFLGLRLVQNALIFTLAAYYYKKLGLSTYHALFGISVLAWGMTHALYNSDLQFSNYTEILCYLTAGLLILHARLLWILPLIVVAAFNRETSGCIAFMLLAAGIRLRPRLQIPRETLVLTSVSLAAFVAILLGLVAFYGWNRPVSGGVGGHFFKEMVLDYRAWAQLFATLGIIPIIAIAATRSWPGTLKAFFWAVIPAWFTIIPFTGGLIETRHYLVPQALVFIPGALFGVFRAGPARRAEPPGESPSDPRSQRD
jgi:hypothetical protein